MQLTGKSVRGALAAAATGLIGAGAQAAPPLDVDTAVLYYAGFERVSAVEAVVDGRLDLGEERSFTAHFVYDALTGASANGATPSTRAQTFTRPSGKGAYTIQPNETPLDDTFHDTRAALALTYEQPLGRMNRATLGLNGSSEYDFLSLGGSASLARDFDRRNRTLSLGASIEHDIIKPVGGAPIPLAEMAAPGVQQPRQDGDQNKTVLDLLLGLTQVVNRSTIMQLNYAYGHLSGYLTDPYKLLSVVGGSGGDHPGEPVRYVYEHRPDTRVKQSLYWEGKHQMGGDVVDLSYRYFWDDWGIRSHTVDLHYRWNLAGARYLQPHLRYYRQSGADFYSYSLLEGNPLPEHASADYRLGEFDGVTAGLKYSQPIGVGRFSVRAEYYLQSGENSPPEAVGVQRELDLFPSVGSAILQVGYARGW